MAVTTHMANVQDGGKVWRKHVLPMSDEEALKRWDLIDVLKLSGTPAKRVIPAKPGCSDAAEAIRKQLAADPYNMYLINELSYLYAQEANLDKCINVLVRGWKRAGEFEDPDVRFRFLLKLCHSSLVLGKYRQAEAVLQDIEEPQEAKNLKAYLLVMIKVYANKPKDTDFILSQTLKAFQRIIEGADGNLAIRYLAICCQDLKQVGAFEAAKIAVEKLATEPQDSSEIQMLETYVQARENKPKKEDHLERNIVAAATVVVASILLYCLYILEGWSLAKLQ